ncbi:MAG: hypothetical protein WD708_04120 [Kiritimatiellia bacterium]
MKKKMINICWSHLTLFCALILLPAGDAFGDALIESDFEKTADLEWPQGWSRPSHGTWEEEDGNGFIRLRSESPGEMIMIYREIAIPGNAKRLKLSWRQRITGLERGENSWFDARIMMEWMDADRGAVTPRPPNPNRGRDTNGWEERSIQFDVPGDARILKFMPSLFRVNTGTFDLDDVVLRVVPADG